MSVRKIFAILGFFILTGVGVWLLQFRGKPVPTILQPVVAGELAAADQPVQSSAALANALPVEKAAAEAANAVHYLLPSAAPLRQIKEVEILAIHVSQGIQTANSTIPLVIQQSRHSTLERPKPIAVRMALSRTNPISLPVMVTAALTFSIPRRLPVSFSQTRAITLSADSPHVSEMDMLTFTFKGMIDVTHAQALTATVKVSSITNQPLAELEQSLSISRTQATQIFYHPIPFPAATRPAYTTIASGAAAAFAAGTLPIALTSDFYRSMPYNTFYCPITDIGPETAPLQPDKKIGILHLTDRDANDQEFIKTPSEACTILHHLNTMRNGLVACHYGPDAYTFVYGWTAGNPMPDFNGFAIHNKRVAFGNTEVERGQRTFAHELLHNLGIEHSTNTLGQIGWDVGNTLVHSPGFWALNNITTSLKSANLFDVSTPAKLSKEAWVAPDTYSTLQSKLAFTKTVYSPQINPLCLFDKLKNVTTPAPTVVVDFCVMKPEEDGGPYRVYPYPLTKLPWRLQPIPAQTRELFTVAFTGRGVETPFTRLDFVDGRIGTDPQNPEDDLFVGFIEAAIPYSEEFSQVLALEITDPRGRPVEIFDRATGTYTTRLVNRFADPAFEIVVTEPPPTGEDVSAPRLVTGEDFTLAWVVENLQGQNVENFEYQVYYSHDGGRIWIPVAVNLPGQIRTITVNAATLCTSDDQSEGGELGIIRILASNGLNSKYTDFRISVLGVETDYCLRGTIREDDLLQPAAPSIDGGL